MQILAVVIPKLEQWQEQGAVGQRKITQWTRYLTIAIALLQSTGLAFLFHNGGGGFRSAATPPASTCSPQLRRRGRVLLIVLTLTAGTALLMWMGELITQRGIGNGMSLLIFASVVSAAARRSGAAVKAGDGQRRCSSSLIVSRRASSWPSCSSSRASAASRCSSPSGWSAGACTAARAPTSRSRSTRPASSRSSSPARCSTCRCCSRNVLPADGLGRRRAGASSTTTWCSPTSIVYIVALRPADHRLRLLLHGDHLRPAPAGRQHPQAGRLHPRHPARARRPSATWPRSSPASRCPGALFIAVIALLPSLLLAVAERARSFPFAGTSILIAVGVALETMKQIDSQLMMRNYEGFLK